MTILTLLLLLFVNGLKIDDNITQVPDSRTVLLYFWTENTGKIGLMGETHIYATWPDVSKNTLKIDTFCMGQYENRGIAIIYGYGLDNLPRGYGWEKVCKYDSLKLVMPEEVDSIYNRIYKQRDSI